MQSRQTDQVQIKLGIVVLGADNEGARFRPQRLACAPRQLLPLWGALSAAPTAAAAADSAAALLLLLLRVAGRGFC